MGRAVSTSRHYTTILLFSSVQHTSEPVSSSSIIVSYKYVNLSIGYPNTSLTKKLFLQGKRLMEDQTWCWKERKNSWLWSYHPPSRRHGSSLAHMRLHAQARTHTHTQPTSTHKHTHKHSSSLATWCAAERIFQKSKTMKLLCFSQKTQKSQLTLIYSFKEEVAGRKVCGVAPVLHSVLKQFHSFNGKAESCDGLHWFTYTQQLRAQLAFYLNHRELAQ